MNQVQLYSCFRAAVKPERDEAFAAADKPSASRRSVAVRCDEPSSLLAPSLVEQRVAEPTLFGEAERPTWRSLDLWGAESASLGSP